MDCVADNKYHPCVVRVGIVGNASLQLSELLMELLEGTTSLHRRRGHAIVFLCIS